MLEKVNLHLETLRMPTANHDVEVHLARQALRALSTAVYLDSGAATALVQEAMAHFKPVLQYVALGDVSA